MLVTEGERENLRHTSTTAQLKWRGSKDLLLPVYVY